MENSNNNNRVTPENAFDIVLVWGKILPSEEVTRLRDIYDLKDRKKFLKEVEALGDEALQYMGISLEEFRKLKLREPGRALNIHHAVPLPWGCDHTDEMTIVPLRDHPKLQDALNNINFYGEKTLPNVDECRLFAFFRARVPIVALTDEDFEAAICSAARRFLENPPEIPALPKGKFLTVLKMIRSVKRIRNHIKILLEKKTLFEKSKLTREQPPKIMSEEEIAAKKDAAKKAAAIKELRQATRRLTREKQGTPTSIRHLQKIASLEEGDVTLPRKEPAQKADEQKHEMTISTTLQNESKFPPPINESPTVDALEKIKDHLLRLSKDRRRQISASRKKGKTK